MASRYLAIGALALMAAVAASSSLPDRVHPRGMRAAPGAAHLYAIGSRGASQSAVGGKTDSVLADLSRHAALARPEHLMADLHALSPAARFARKADGTAMVAIDAATRGNPQALKTALQSLGLEQAAVYLNDVGGFLPVSAIEAAAARSEVASMRAAMSHTRSAGPVSTQGDYAQRSDVVRTDYPSLTGTGVTVAVLSDSFNCYAVYAEPNSGVPASGAEGYAYNGFTADYASDVSTGALPSNVQIVEEPTYAPIAPCMGFQSPDSDGQNTGLPFTDEGRAILQVVYAIAPGANLVFRTGAISEADFASGIEALAVAPYNAKVIADDLGYFDEPFFQDGLLAQAIDTVEAQGVAYFSAAGNNQETPSYQNTTPVFGTLSNSAPNAGEYLLNFDASGATTVTSLPVTIPPLTPGDFVAVLVEWDQPYVTGCTGSAECTGATSQIDVCLTGSTGTDVLIDYDNDVTSCSGPNPLGTDPYQVMLIANPAVGSTNTAQQNINIQIGLANGTKAPGRLIVVVEDDGQGSTINDFSPNGPTIQGHPGAAGAAGVGAAFYFTTPRCGTTPTQLEAYSSAGGAPILFDTAGTRLATPVVRQKPDFVAPDGVNSTFLGFTLASDSPPFPSTGLLATSITECQNRPSYPNFFGTSAATPHAAAIAALMLQANPTATPSQIYGALDKSALAIGSPTPNLSAGYGFIQADAALALIPPGAPTLTLSASSVVAGKPVTITWSSLTATACTASGDWSGALKASGSQTLTPSAAGTDKYTLTCTNAGGNSVAATATLTVTAAAPPAVPSLTLAAKSIAVGASTTITWSSSNATGCTASGSWTGALAISGTKTLTPTAAGTYTYSLTCSNAGGTSKPATATLTMTAAVPAAPSLSLAATSIAVGASTTITWSSSNATSCTASGSWSGALATSGTQTLMPTTAGTDVYSLTCSNAGGTSKSTSATLTVAAAPSSGGGGGGALDGLSLLGLAALFAGRRARASGRWVRPGRAAGAP
jgi:Subtilase family